MSIDDGVLQRFAAYVQHMANEINKDPRNKGDRLLVVLSATVVHEGADGANFAVVANCNAGGMQAAIDAIAQKRDDLAASESSARPS